MKKRVLIIKENDLFNNIIKRNFQNSNYEIQIMNDLNHLSTKKIINKPDYIIFDSELLSGTITNKIKSNEFLKEIPILNFQSLINNKFYNVNSSINTEKAKYYS